MYALLLTLCLSGGDCYQTAPELFLSFEDCRTELAHMVATGQLSSTNARCEKESI